MRITKTMIWDQTKAGTVAEKFDGDGQIWETEDGETFEKVCETYDAGVDYRDGHGTDVIRYTFPDGSVLTAAGDAWDFGYPDCYCWQGVGHFKCVSGKPEGSEKA